MPKIVAHVPVIVGYGTVCWVLWRSSSALNEAYRNPFKADVHTKVVNGRFGAEASIHNALL